MKERADREKKGMLLQRKGFFIDDGCVATGNPFLPPLRVVRAKVKLETWLKASAYKG
jgi:hypothetical protein